MAEEQTSELLASEDDLRPVILADEATLRDCDAYLRHCFVGFADESAKGILLCPADAEMGQVAVAPMEVIQYPPLMSFGLWRPVLSPLIEKLTRLEPTILHCLSESKLKLTLRLSRLLDIPFVVSANSVPNRNRKRFCTGKFSGVMTSSRARAARMRKEMGCEADLIRYIKVGTFVSDRVACFAGSSRLVTMVMVHPLESCGDFEPVFSAIKHLSIDGVEMVVALMGSGRADHKVRRLIADLGLGNVINIVPEVRPLRQVFSGADVFIKPRLSKGFDFALLDAMSEGMAVAACKGDDEDILREGETAAMFEEGDHVSIYTTLGSLLRERDHARRLAGAGQDMLRAEYRVSGMVADMIATYRWAMARWKK
jgi:glycosyltransferase involved in cell wall biosynthesis